MGKQIRLDQVPPNVPVQIGGMTFRDGNTVEVEGLKSPIDLRRVTSEIKVGEFVITKNTKGFLVVSSTKATYYLRYEEQYGCWYYTRQKRSGTSTDR